MLTLERWTNARLLSRRSVSHLLRSREMFSNHIPVSSLSSRVSVLLPPFVRPRSLFFLRLFDSPKVGRNDSLTRFNRRLCATVGARGFGCRVSGSTPGTHADLTPRVHYRASVIKVSGTVGLFAGRTFKYERGNATRPAVPPDEILLIRRELLMPISTIHWFSR